MRRQRNRSVASQLKRRVAQWLGTASVVVVALLFWQYAVPHGVVPGVKAEYLGTPSGIWVAFRELASDGYAGSSLWQHVTASLFRTLSGFAIGAAVAAPLGVALGYSRHIGSIVLPIFSFLRPIPALAFVPVVVIWLGIGEPAKIFVIFMTAFLYVILGAVSGVRSTPTDFLRMSRNYQMSTTSTLARIVLPAAMPQILVSLRTAMALSWAVVVAAELIAAQSGLGYLIESASQVYKINTVYVGVAMIGLVGILIEGIFHMVERRILHWVGK